MRILTFTSLLPSSIRPYFGIFVYQRVAHLAKRGHSVVAVAPVAYAPAWSGKEEHRLPQFEEFNGIPIHRPRYPLIPKISMPVQGLSMYAACLPLVRRLHRERPFDLIDAHYVYPDSLAAVLIGRKLGIPALVSARGTDINVFSRMRLIRPMIRWTLRHAAGAIGVSGALRDQMVALGAEETRARAIGNGIDLARFSPEDKEAARKALAIPPQARVVVSVAALVEGKGHAELLHAIHALKDSVPFLRVYLIGKGPLRSRLEQLAHDLRLEDVVTFVGGVPNQELRRWYSAADMSCLASHREGWANVWLESMACGTPVVATRVGAAEDVITPAAGVLVPPAEATSLADGLRQGFERAWDRAGIARAGAARTWDAVAKDVEDFISLVLHTSPQHSSSSPAGAKAHAASQPARKRQ